jgi:hypothetical protein
MLPATSLTEPAQSGRENTLTVFSLEPRCQGLRGSQKYTGRPVSMLNLVGGHLFALVPGQRAAQLIGQPHDVLGESVGDQVGTPASGERDEHQEPGLALDEGGDSGLSATEEQVSFRKSVGRPGGSGVAEVALRFGRSLGMSARSSGAPWLLIEMCARSLVTDVSAGCPQGS